MRHYLCLLFGLLATGADALSSHRISLMTYNVENLFDNVDDPGKADETYLPRTEKRRRGQTHADACALLASPGYVRQCLSYGWDNTAVAGKLQAVAGVLAHAGADLVVLQEVENASILARLLDEPVVRDFGYRAVLIEGHDRRGIDVAVLTRLPLAHTPPRWHAPECVPTPTRNDPMHVRCDLPDRGILQVPVRLPNGAVLQVFAVHLQSPRTHVSRRVLALARLARIVRIYGGRHFVVLGDFNITSTEENDHDPLEKWESLMYDLTEWGCEGCRGSYYYGGDQSWSWLDKILVPPRLLACEAGWQVAPASLRVLTTAPYQSTARGTPRTFAKSKGEGVSDHFPVLVDLQLASASAGGECSTLH